MSIYEKLSKIQTELKAPKGQYNSFGKYKYRSCEDIMESVKPLLAKYECALNVSDSVNLIGDRYYIMATATLTDFNGESISNTALARESTEKKGMDDSQITGTASSYARKYCLNGLFCIDDTKDADTDEYKNQQSKTDNVVLCDKCKSPILRTKKRDGTAWETADIIAYSKTAFDGKTYCPMCMKDEMKKVK